VIPKLRERIGQAIADLEGLLVCSSLFLFSPLRFIFSVDVNIFLGWMWVGKLGCRKAGKYRLSVAKETDWVFCRHRLRREMRTRLEQPK
jgi:hypothetical protein